MNTISKLFTLALCAFSTVDTGCGALNNVNSHNGAQSAVGITMDPPMVKLVNAGANGCAFAFPAGDLLVEKGNTGQDTFGVFQQLQLEDNVYAFKNRATGFYIVAAGDDHLITPPAEPPTVFEVDAADDGTSISGSTDSGLVWEAVYTGGNVGRVMLTPDRGSTSQRWKIVPQNS
ncbi:hypothetical protein FB451DRAFT_1269094 [Mycena latifolia]|nr:hypothetical protein FB451DRAFT_1269094 [Mycena latifolia]